MEPTKNQIAKIIEISLATVNEDIKNLKDKIDVVLDKKKEGFNVDSFLKRMSEILVEYEEIKTSLEKQRKEL